MRVLALNSGSNSLKFEIVEAQPGGLSKKGGPDFGQSLLSGAYDYIGKPSGGTFSLLEGSETTFQESRPTRDYGHAAEDLCDWFEAGGARQQGIQSLADIECVGHRVVHGADVFDRAVEIDRKVIGEIEKLADLAPLHNDSALDVIRAVAKKNKHGMPAVAVFDTVFHRTIPEAAAAYALPRDLAKRYRIRRYGFHGLSHRYMLLRFGQLSHRSPRELKLVTAHLEGGSSVAAICEGKSVETSMGFTPLEGLVMGTRSGDLDAAIVTFLMRKEQMDSQKMDEFLNKRCGLLALSGDSADTRELVKRMDVPAVELAVDVFCHRVRKYIGAYLAVLGGADAIVLGGGISENTPLFRERICRGLSWFGLEFEAQRNEQVIDCEGEITADGARLPVWVIPSRENLMVANEAVECLAH